MRRFAAVEHDLADRKVEARTGAGDDVARQPVAGVGGWRGDQQLVSGEDGEGVGDRPQGIGIADPRLDVRAGGTQRRDRCRQPRRGLAASRVLVGHPVTQARVQRRCYDEHVGAARVADHVVRRVPRDRLVDDEQDITAWGGGGHESVP